MSEHPKTIKVKPLSPEQGSHLVINEDDFDEAVHKKLTAAELSKVEAELAGGEETLAEEPSGEGGE